jgi:hypothetical protein
MFSHLTKEVPMLSIPKVVGVMSCGFLLCLGLSGTAALAADDMQLGQSDERIGGQAGYRSEADMLRRVAGDSSGERIGGQAGYRSEADMLRGVASDSSGERVGGQAGLRGDEEKLNSSPMKN